MCFMKCVTYYSLLNRDDHVALESVNSSCGVHSFILKRVVHRFDILLATFGTYPPGINRVIVDSSEGVDIKELGRAPPVLGSGDPCPLFQMSVVVPLLFPYFSAVCSSRTSRLVQIPETPSLASHLSLPVTGPSHLRSFDFPTFCDSRFCICIVHARLPPPPSHLQILIPPWIAVHFTVSRP